MSDLAQVYPQGGIFGKCMKSNLTLLWCLIIDQNIFFPLTDLQTRPLDGF